MLQTIKGYNFDLTQKIRLLHTKNKFWQVQMKGETVNYRCGVIRQQNEEHKIIEVEKQYDSDNIAKATVITKLAQKIGKGYFSNTIPKIEQPKKQQMEMKPIKRKTTKNLPKNMESKILYKHLIKNDEELILEVVNNQLKISRKSEQHSGFQIKTFANYDEAVDYVHSQIDWYTKQGFTIKNIGDSLKANSTAIYNKEQMKKSGQKQDQSTLTRMTDNAMFLKSNNFFKPQEQAGENVYLPSVLGDPVDECIKCLLAENYKQQIDPTGWIMSQKLDGVRCLWTGSEMYSRNGNKFNFPKFFTKNWPNSQLDGQLFIGRGQFSLTLSAVKKNIPIDSEWNNLKYLVFDAPGLRQPFKMRIKTIESVLSKIENPYLKCHAHRQCSGWTDLFAELQQINSAGGEGVMLRNPESFYEGKRSKNLLKVKTFHDDQAEIIGYTAGTGRCAGWIGALKVRNSHGVQFQVGSGLNDYLRQNPPPKFSKITYKYQQFNKQSGKPRFPTFLRCHDPV